MTSVVLFLLASFFVLGTGVGLMRLPDSLSRLHASTKAASLGTAFALLALINAFRDPWVIVLAILTLSFIFLTAPVSAHAIASRLQKRDEAPKDPP
jgi:monovalent cation/proton antiporter MnhG/PhaG subunit